MTDFVKIRLNVADKLFIFVTCWLGQQEVALPIAEYRSLQTFTQTLAGSIVKVVAGTFCARQPDHVIVMLLYIVA